MVLNTNTNNKDSDNHICIILYCYLLFREIYCKINAVKIWTKQIKIWI